MIYNKIIRSKFFFFFKKEDLERKSISVNHPKILGELKHRTNFRVSRPTIVCLAHSSFFHTISVKIYVSINKIKLIVDVNLLKHFYAK